MISALFLGFLMGFRHALEADHVLAVASISGNRNTASALKQGMTWGVGHTLTLLLVGGIVLFLDFPITTNLGLMLEFAVGIMLIILGADLLRKIAMYHFHLQVHKHSDGVSHIHFYTQTGDTRQNEGSHNHPHLKDFPLRALLIGFMHGLAGSSVLVLITLQAVTSPYMGLVYILFFGAGSILSMVLLSIAIAIPMKASLNKFAWLYNGISCSVAFATLSLGAYIVYDIGLVNGLLVS